MSQFLFPIVWLHHINPGKIWLHAAPFSFPRRRQIWTLAPFTSLGGSTAVKKEVANSLSNKAAIRVGSQAWYSGNLTPSGQDCNAHCSLLEGQRASPKSGDAGIGAAEGGGGGAMQVKTSAAANHQHEGSVGSVGSPALGTPEHPPHPLLLPTRVPPPVEICTRGRESLLWSWWCPPFGTHFRVQRLSGSV